MRSEPQFAAGTLPDARATEHRIPMRDGVRLATDVYLPPRAQWPLPAVLIRMPYDKTGRYCFLPEVGEHFAAHGFVCVIQDVRGKYRSEGERTAFANEANDGWDTVEWIIAQEWSNGAVGTWGDSYYGFTQWALASTGHPAHRAMVPRVTGHHFGNMRPGGGMPTRTLLDWVVDCWSQSELVVENGVDHDVRPAIDSVHPALHAGRAHLERFLAVAEAPEAAIEQLFPGGNPASHLRVAALHTGGWFDNLQFWQLEDWRDAQHSPAAPHQYLRMWSSDHEDYRWREPGTALGPDFGIGEDPLRAHVPQLLAEPISFFRHYLADTAGGGLPLERWDAPTIRYEHVRVGHRDAAEWPPRRVTALRLGLDGSARSQDGVLSDADAPRTAESVSWVHDPERPVPYLIASEWNQNCPGLPDEQHLHLRDDLAVFTGAPLGAPLDIVGSVNFTARITAPTARTHVIARLFDVAPDDSAHVILGNAIDAIADGSTAFELWLGDTAYRLPAGHRLRLVISTSLHGQYVVHPGTDADPWLATDLARAEQRLHLAGAELHLTQEPR